MISNLLNFLHLWRNHKRENIMFSRKGLRVDPLEVLPLHLELDLPNPHVPFLGAACPVAWLQGVFEGLGPDLAVELSFLGLDLLSQLGVFLEELSLLSLELEFPVLDLLLDGNEGHL